MSQEYFIAGLCQQEHKVALLAATNETWFKFKTYFQSMILLLTLKLISWQGEQLWSMCAHFKRRGWNLKGYFLDFFVNLLLLW